MLANSLEVVRGLRSPIQELLKRGFDIAGATVGLMLLLPLIFLVSLAITSSSSSSYRSASSIRAVSRVFQKWSISDNRPRSSSGATWPS